MDRAHFRPWCNKQEWETEGVAGGAGTQTKPQNLAGGERRGEMQSLLLEFNQTV